MDSEGKTGPDLLRTVIIALIATLAVCPSAVAAEPGFSGAVRDAAGNWLSDV